MKVLLFACFAACAAAMSMEIRHESVSEAGGSCKSHVSLYQHDHFRGKRAAFRAGNCDFHCFIRKMYNDQASSIKVPKGCVAYLYQHSGYRGWRAIFPPGNYNMRAFKARGARNDDASSIKVLNQRVARKPPKGKKCRGRLVNICKWVRYRRCGRKWAHKCYWKTGWRTYRYRCRRGWSWRWCSRGYRYRYRRCHRFTKPYCVHGKRRSCRRHCKVNRHVQSRFFLKYASKWPHCQNIRCITNVHLSSMKAQCAKYSTCNGFSWTRGSTAFGWGCLKKNCKNNGKNGFGHGSHGYYAKRAKRAPTKNYKCTLFGDPHIKSFTMSRGYYNHYDMGLFTAFKNRYVTVSVLNGRSTTWRNNAVIHSVRVNFGGKRYAVGINQRNCRTSGNLRSTMRFGSVTVQWSRSCRRRVGDRHINVKISYNGPNLNGISGSCIKKPKRRVSWATLYKLAKKNCGKDWRNTIKHMKKRCGNRRNMGCYQDQILKICRQRSAKLRAAANSKRLAAYYAARAKGQDKQGKRYQWYQKYYASRAAKYTRSAKGYHARARANDKSQFKHKSARRAYLRERASHLRNAARHSRTASVYARRASAAYRKASAANRNAGRKARSAAYYLRMYRRYKGYERSHKVRKSRYNRASIAHGKRATAFKRKAAAARAKANKARAIAKKYNDKIKKWCSHWKRLAGQHARISATYYRAAAVANGHLRRSKRYKASADRNARTAARNANRMSRIAGKRLRSYYRNKAASVRARARARNHHRAARANNNAARKYRAAAKRSRNAANRATRNANNSASKARRQAALARRHRAIANSHKRAANSNKNRSKSYKGAAARAARNAKTHRGHSSRHARAAAKAAAAAKALGL